MIHNKEEDNSIVCFTVVYLFCLGCFTINKIHINIICLSNKFI